MMLEIERPIPSQLVRGCSPSASVRIGVLSDVGGEQEECDRDEPLGALLGVLGESAGAGEAPDHDDRGEALDHGVKAETEQRDRAGEHRRGDRDRALGAHVGEAEPGQRLRAADQAVALGQLEPVLCCEAGAGAATVGSSSDGVLIGVTSASSRCASSSWRPASVSA